MRRGARALRAPPRRSPRRSRRSPRSGLGYIAARPAVADALGRRGAAHQALARARQALATGRTLYILDEPTTGLHFDDIRKLLARARRASSTPATPCVVIEHNLDVIKSADWVIDLGPEGGDGGGRIVAAGTPEEVAAVHASHTGRFLAPLLTSRSGARHALSPGSAPPSAAAASCSGACRGPRPDRRRGCRRPAGRGRARPGCRAPRGRSGR